VIVPVVSWLSPKPDAGKVDEIFACYDKTTQVRQSQSLGND
jgi:hypothetical protein